MPLFGAEKLRDLGSNEAQAGTMLDVIDDARLRQMPGMPPER
jgi:hypothetical protein